MRFRRFCSCLLAFACISAVLFSASASASATAINDINILTYLDEKVYEGDNVTLSFALPVNTYTEWWIKYTADSSTSLLLTENQNKNIQWRYLARDDGIIYGTSYLLGHTGDAFNAIDVTDIKDNKVFTLTFNLSLYGIHWVNNQQPEPKFNVSWYDESGGYLGTSSTGWLGVFNPGDAMDYDVEVTFTKPVGAKYMIPNVYIAYIETRSDFKLTVNNFTMAVDMTALEADSKLQQGIYEQLEEQNKEAKKQTSWLSNIFDAIGNLGSDIVNGLSNAIVGLFVPSEEDMVAMKDQWEQLLSDRFGAVYESTTIIDDWAEAFSFDGTAREKIEIPEVTVNLAGVPFVFGGWDVDVIPDGFDGIIDTLKLIVNIACTFLFVNGMKKRLESVLT